MCVVVEDRSVTTPMKGGGKWLINHLQMYAGLCVCVCMRDVGISHLFMSNLQNH